MKKAKLFLVVSIIALMAGCSSGDGEKAFSGKNLAITVSGSRSFNPNIIHGRIDYYLITITAQDLNIPFTQRFGGDSESATMLGIPTGTGRTILIEAYNPNGLVIRRGQREGIDIIPNQISHVEIAMHSVPIFTNIADKSAISGRRLIFEIFGEPGSRLEIQYGEGEAAKVCVDTKTDKALVNTTDEEGLFTFLPEEFEEGIHTFSVSDLDSREASDVTISLFDSTVRPGIAINSGGYLKRHGDEMVLVGAGQPNYRRTEVGDEDLGGATLIDVVEMMY